LQKRREEVIGKRRKKPKKTGGKILRSRGGRRWY
jgi:hypothetical protein